MKKIVTMTVIAATLIILSSCKKEPEIIPEKALAGTSWEHVDTYGKLTLSFYDVEEVAIGSGSSRVSYYEGTGRYVDGTSRWSTKSGDFTYTLNGISVNITRDDNAKMSGSYKNESLYLSGKTFIQVR